MDTFGISIVICTYNGSERIGATLQALFAQQFKNPNIYPWEIIIIDNASTDSTYDLCKKIIKSSGFKGQIRIEIEPNAGLNFARLCGLGLAQYDWMLFCDDDNHLSSDYLEQAYKLLHNNSAIGVLGGCGIPFFEIEKPNWFDDYSHSFAVGEQSNKEGKIDRYPAAVYGAGSLYRRAPLHKIFNSGFSAIMSDRTGTKLSSSGDIEWCWLLQLAGYEIWYSSQLTFIHVLPAERLNWDYYLKLKKGISLGVAPLFAYTYFFKNSCPNLFFFSLEYFYKLGLSILFFLKYKVGLMLNNNLYTKNERDLREVILRSKSTSFMVNCTQIFNQFKKINKLIHDLL